MSFSHFVLEYGASKKVINCIEHQGDDLRTLPVQFMNGTETCLVMQFNKILDSLNVIVREVNQTELQVKKEIDEFSKCTHSTEKKVCILKVNYIKLY